jgi:hypothetical protein
MSVHHCIISAETVFLGAPKKTGAAPAMMCGRSLQKASRVFSRVARSTPAGLSGVFTVIGVMGGNHHDASNATAPVSREVADQFTATHGMCNERDALQIKLRHHSAEIVGQGVEFIASRGFRGTAMSAAVIGNATPAVADKKAIWYSHQLECRPQGARKTSGLPVPQSL